MRTMKKALCFILAMVFVLGLCTIGAGAAFTDDAKVTYTDAVNVMSGLGLIKGYPDGSFKPKDNITRAEAAVLIARMMLGEKRAEQLPKRSTGFDDEIPDWAAGAVSYCANQGIINGRGDGKFYPNDNITGLEMAKMLLCAAGYGQEGEYVGRGWDTEVFKDAVRKGIYSDDIDVDNFDAPATREECAAYVLNTLTEVPLQDYSEKNGYSDVKDKDSKNVTFGSSVWSFVSVKGQVQANEGTGAAYTTVYPRQDDGTFGGKPLYFAYDYGTADPLSVVAHEVKVYYKDVEKKGESGNYYEAYTLEDISTTFSNAFGNFNDTYVALYAANKDNADVQIKNIPVWNNYTYEKGNDTYVSYFGDFFGGKANIDKNVKTIGDMKDKTSGSYSNLFYDSGTYIMDSDGMVIARTSSSTKTDKVIKIESDGITLKTAGKIKTADYSAYDAIAVGDYVTVKTAGTFTNIGPTTTRDVKISTLSNGTINGSIYSSANSIVDGSVGITGGYLNVEAGKEYRLYGYQDGFFFWYFDAVAAGDDTVGNYVFLHENFQVSTSGTVASRGKGTTDFYIRVIDATGEVISYKINDDLADDPNGDKSTADALKAGANGAVTGGWARGVYTLKFNDDGEVTKLDTVGGGALNKDANRTSFLKDAGGNMYYVTNDTKIFYLKKTTDTGAVIGPSTIKALPNANPAGTIYAYWGDKAASGYELKAIWIDDTPKAADASNNSFIYFGVGNFYGTPFASLPSAGGTGVVGDKAYSYYTAYIDGVKTENVYVKNPEVIANNSFYTYTVEDGVYTLTKTPYTGTGSNTKVATDVVVDDDAYNTTTGKFYLNSDGVDISGLKFCNISGATTKDGFSSLTINSMDDVMDLLEDYTVQITYMYKQNSTTKVQTPIGAIFVTLVTAK